MRISAILFFASLACIVVALSQIAGEVFTGFGLAIGAILFGLAFITRALAGAEEASAHS
jgi:hypothetical protein